MKDNQVVLRGFDYVLQRLLLWLTEPERALMTDMEAEEKLSKPLTEFLQEFSIKRWLDLDNLLITAELYRQAGHSETEIRKLTIVDSEKLLETYNALTTLRRLVDKGVVQGADFKRFEFPTVQ